MKIIIFVFVIFAIGSILSFEDAFATISADHGREYQPTQPNAFASYNNSTNQVQVSWDFNTFPADTKCLLKGDFWFITDLNTNYDATTRNSDNSNHKYHDTVTRVTSFTPLYYSPVTSTPVPILAVDTQNAYAEEVPCTDGEMRIDIDTVMSHPTNVKLDGVTPRQDLQIFLTFYVPLANGDFDLASKYRIDEVFVMYTPNLIFDENAYRVYGCGDGSDHIDNGIGDQIGSVLYIDASGSNGSVIAYGDNGDNCGDHLYLENNQYVDIGMGGSGSHGSTTYGIHIESSFSSLIQVVSQTSDTKKKSGGSSYNPPPTLGVDKDGRELVEGGFSYNGNVTDVKRYWTDYPLITTEIGKKNIVEIIVYDNGGINALKWVQLFLGVPEVGKPTSLSEVTGQLTLSNTEFEDFIITDKQNLIQNFNATSIIPVKCKANSNNESCLKITFEYEYREAPLYNVVAVDVMDNKRASWTHYFNDGVEVIGESLNEPPTNTMFVKTSSQMKGVWLDLTRTDKVHDVWTDNNGIEYQHNNGQYDRITPMPQWKCNDTPLDEIMNGGTRQNCHFREKLPWLWQN